MHKTCPLDLCDVGLCADEKKLGVVSSGMGLGLGRPELTACLLLEDGNLNEMDLANSLGLQDASLPLGAALASRHPVDSVPVQS